MVARVERPPSGVHAHEAFGSVPGVVGPVEFRKSVSAVALPGMFAEIAEKIRAGNYTVPVVLVKAAGQWSRTKISDTFPAAFAAALFLELVRDTGTLEAVGFDMHCGCGLRVEVLR